MVPGKRGENQGREGHMIVIAGGTGRLGTEVARLLRARDEAVRAISRDPRRGAHLEALGVEVVRGDVRDPDSLRRAVGGARTVVSCVQGLTATDGGSPASVDRDGNRALVAAAAATGDAHVVLVSVVGAAPDHPMELVRMKHAAEEDVRALAPTWTIVRATGFMETWIEILGEPLRRTGRGIVLGRGRNPVNFVAVGDVARFVEAAAVDPALHGATLEIGGPDDVTLDELVRALQPPADRGRRLWHVPVPVLRRAAALAARPRPDVARQLHAAVAMDAADLAFDAAAARPPRPEVPMTPLSEVIARTAS
jgi:uncharacterized protein YbjT (DUF2867 family)